MSDNWNCELTEVLIIIYMKLYIQLYLEYVISLITQIILENEQGIIEISRQQ